MLSQARPTPAFDLDLIRRAVENIPSMVAYWDASLRCRFANRAHQRWMGISAESILGKHISELLGPAYAPALPHIEAALRGEPQEFEREIADPLGGPSRHSLLNYTPDVVEGKVRGFFVVVTDVSEMKRTQLALEASEAQFSRTIDEAPIGMALVALDGRFIRVNQVLCEIVGYPPEELTGLTFQAITHPDDLDTDLELAGKLRRGEIPRYRLEKRYIRKDGAIVDVMLSGSVVHDRDGAPLHFVAQIEDITERKRLEDQLRFAEARATGILATSADAIISIDETQRITMFNEGAEQMFGYSREEMIGAPIDRLIPTEFHEKHRKMVGDLAKGEDKSSRMGERGAKIQGVRKNGERFPADGAISKLEVAGQRILTVTLRDITEQARTEKEQQFLAEVGLVFASSLDYEETLSRIAELSVRELADVCIVDLVGDHAEVHRFKVVGRDPTKSKICEVLANLPLDRGAPHLLREVLESREPFLVQFPSPELLRDYAQSEEHLRALQATEVRSMVAVPLIAHDTLLGAIGFLSSSPSHTYGPADLRMAQELACRASLSIENARLYRAATRATQARDDVLGIVAHDLRNPVNSILMQAALLRRSKPETDTGVRSSADMITRAAKRMDRLIQDLLDVTRIEVGHLSLELSRVGVESLVSDVVETQRPLLQAASLELRVELGSGLPDVWADRHRLLQIFENLLGNAMKFTRKGGVVTVGAASQGPEVLFWVADTGSGISAENLPHLFDRFWQGGKDERRMGAGLGLAIVKGIVEAHGGRIWVESHKGEGTKVSFALPAKPPLPS